MLTMYKKEKVKLLLFPQQLLLSLCIYSPVLNLPKHCNVPVETLIEFLLVKSKFHLPQYFNYPSFRLLNKTYPLYVYLPFK
jgi:hypothetical protein